MSDNDLMVSVKRAREFLEDGNKIRFVLKFRGRQITHPEFGHAIIRKVVESLADISKVERSTFGRKATLSFNITRKEKTHPQDDQPLAEK